MTRPVRLVLFLTFLLGPVRAVLAQQLPAPAPPQVWYNGLFYKFSPPRGATKSTTRFEMQWRIGEVDWFFDTTSKGGVVDDLRPGELRLLTPFRGPVSWSFPGEARTDSRTGQRYNRFRFRCCGQPERYWPIWPHEAVVALHIGSQDPNETYCVRVRAYDRRDREGTLSEWSSPAAWNDSKNECGVYFEPQDNRLSGDKTAAAPLVVYGDRALGYSLNVVNPDNSQGVLLLNLASLDALAQTYSGDPVLLEYVENPFSGKPIYVYYLPAINKIQVLTYYPDMLPHQVNKPYNFLINEDRTLTIISW